MTEGEMKQCEHTGSHFASWKNFRFSILDLEESATPMNEAEMKQRTQQFALGVLSLAEALPKTRTGNAIAHQIVRSGTSVGANYRALCRSKSRADFMNRASIIEEEADETAFWLEMVRDSGLLSAETIQPLLREANELVAMFVASRKTAATRRGG
jgi:four helix bundle protein